MSEPKGFDQQKTSMKSIVEADRPTLTTGSTQEVRDTQHHYISLGQRCNSKRRPKAVTNFSIDAIIGNSTNSQSSSKSLPSTRPASEPSALIDTGPTIKVDACPGNVMSIQPVSSFVEAASHSDDGNNKTQVKKYRPKNFQCLSCKMAFSNNGQLKNHIRIHTGERPFVCDMADCKKTFTRNEELTRHKLIHTGIRPHACTHCGKRFGRKDHLKKHVRTHERKKLRKRVFVPAAAAAAAAAAVAAATSQQHKAAAIDEIVFASQASKTFKTSANAIKSIRSISIQQKRPSPVQQQTMAPTPNPFLAAPMHTNPALRGLNPMLGSTSFTDCLPPLPLPPVSTAFDPSPIHQAAAAAAAVNFAAAAAVVTSTSAGGSSSATFSSPTTNLQLLANDYWTKWYNILGYYQQQTCQPRTEDNNSLGGLHK